jgi:hypothetical protein
MAHTLTPSLKSSQQGALGEWANIWLSSREQSWMQGWEEHGLHRADNIAQGLKVVHSFRSAAGYHISRHLIQLVSSTSEIKSQITFCSYWQQDAYKINKRSSQHILGGGGEANFSGMRTTMRGWVQPFILQSYVYDPEHNEEN